jgi:hypothetical protein
MCTFGVWCNKLLSLIGVTCQAHVSPVKTSYVITCTCSLATGAHKPFCAPDDRGLCCEHYPAKYSAPWRCQLKSRHSLCTIYCIASRSARVCVSGPLRAVDICPAVTGSTAPHSQLTSRLFLPMHRLVMNLYQRYNLYIQKWNHFILRHVTMFLVGNLILVPILRRHDTLTASFGGCMTTKYIYFPYTMIFMVK